MDSFVNVFELKIPEQQILLALDVSLKATLSKWWASHKEEIKHWQQCRRFMQVIFALRWNGLRRNMQD
jgi:hypothetical protein